MNANTNRKEYNPINRRQRLFAIAAAIIVSGLLFDGVASIRTRYDINGSAFARHAQPTQVAQASTGNGQAQR